MSERLLHVFGNTPHGREALLQSLHFCKTLGVSLHLHVPQSKQFLMYFENDIVQVDLDAAYLTSPETAEDHARQLAEGCGVKINFLKPRNYTAPNLPDVPTRFNYMACPRGISDLSSKIGLGYIGPKVRRIIQSSLFPVFLPGRVFKSWRSITVFYGGSGNAGKALHWGVHLSKISGLPLDLFTFREGRAEDYFSAQIRASGVWEQVQRHLRAWHQIDRGGFEESLYAVDHEALLIVGAYGHGLIKDFLFGSKMETIQAWMPNNMLVVGPNCVLGP
ncbi:MAG: universal stress protein [Desulfobacteraceae bacterium]|nr:MAG: universal stress protein [Desulfobacteraceae bacterium]